MGSVRVYATPCAPGGYVQPVAIATPVPGPGCVGPNCGQVCTPTCVCPPGTVLVGRECVKRECPPPQVLNPATGACACPQGTVLRDGKCVPVIRSDIKCVPPQVFDPATGACGCPPGLLLVNGQCVSAHCRPPLVWNPETKSCVCPRGEVLSDGKCVPQVCPPPLVPGPCTCPEGTVLVDGMCLQRGALIVKKTVTSRTEVPLPAGTLFPMTVTCGPPTQTWSFSLTANGSHTVTGIPDGETCTVSETLPPLPPNLCPRGTVPVWSPAPTYTPPSVVISGTTQTIVVHNSVICEKPGQLSVTKTVRPDPRGIATTLSFPMTVHCTNPNGTYNVTVNGNTSSVPINVPIGSVCTVTEVQPPLPAGCTWLPPVTTSVTIHAGLNQTMG